jgi:hypothetical protein
MIRIAITPAAYTAIAATLALGTVAIEAERAQASLLYELPPWLQLSGQERVFSVATLLSGGQKPMTKNFIFAHDVILDPETGKIVAVVRDGGVWRDGAKIAVLVGSQMYDLNGNLLGKLAAGSLPISFKKLVEGKSAHAERALVA